jgi:hypothetical protein
MITIAVPPSCALPESSSPQSESAITPEPIPERRDATPHFPDKSFHRKPNGVNITHGRGAYSNRTTSKYLGMRARFQSDQKSARDPES